MGRMNRGERGGAGGLQGFTRKRVKESCAQTGGKCMVDGLVDAGQTKEKKEGDME